MATPTTPRPTDPGGNWLSVNEACEVAGVSRRTIYNWLGDNRLITRRTAGGSVRILESSLWRDSWARIAPVSAAAPSSAPPVVVQSPPPPSQREPPPLSRDYSPRADMKKN